MPDSPPNDPLYAEQWALHQLEAEAAWQRLGQISRNAPITVAVVDWGIQDNHEDLASGNIKGGRVIPPDNNDFSDDGGHGTMLAGIIAAARDNEAGICGLLPEAKLLAVKFIDADTPPTASNAALAIRYAIEQGAKVINASWHVSLDQKALRDAIEEAAQKDILVVVGAGNDGGSNELAPFFPADYRYDNMISVMASDRNDSKPGFSNYGGEKVDVAAPGQHILSASIYRGLPPRGPVLSPETEFNPAYRFYDGTSAAAAFASGAAAMLLSIDDTWKPNEIRDHLIASADECAGLRGLCRANGRLNLRRAVCGPFSVTVPGAEAGFKSGEKITVKWQLEYESPVVKTVEILMDGKPLTEAVPVAAEYCEVELPNKPIPNAVLRVKCAEKNLYTDSGPFVVA